MKAVRFSAFAAFVAASLLLVGSQSQAGLVDLPSNLGVLTTAGNYATVGDKTFTFLSYSGTTVGGLAIPASSIAVSALAGPPIGFELTGPIIATPGTSEDIALGYTVSSAGAPITSVSLIANGDVTGTGAARVTESVYTDSSRTTFLGQIAVTAGIASLNLGAGYSSLFITKDIVVTVPGSGIATFSIIDQTFTQGVPEPASVAMMGLGLVGVLSYRFRRKAVSA